MRLLALWLFRSNRNLKIIMILVIFIGSLSAISEFYFISQTSKLLGLFLDKNDILNIKNNFSFKEISVLIYTVIFLWIAVLIRLTNIYFIGWAASRWGRDIAEKILIKITKNPETLGEEGKNNYVSSLTEQATEVTWLCLRPFIRLINNFLVVLALAYAVIRENIISGTTVIFILTLIYLLTSIWAKPRMASHSKVVNNMQLRMSSHINGITNNLFEVFISPKNSFFYKEANLIQKKMRTSQLRAHFYAVFPRYFIEAVGISLLILIAFISSSETTNGFIIAGVLAAASQRLLPIAQEIYGSFASIKSSSTLLRRFDNYLMASQKVSFVEVIKEKNNILLKNILVQKYSKNILDINGFYTLYDHKINLITGESGKGKTTLIRVLSGFEKVQSGTIQINNIKICTFKKKASNFLNYMSSIALVTQEADVINGSIYRNIALKDNLSEDEIKKADDALKTVGLNNEIKSIIQKKDILSNDLKLLSGGQLRRLALARAIFGNKKIILLDEPSSGLDKVNIKLVAKSIENCSKEANIIISSHDQYLIKLLQKNIGTVIKL